MQQLPETILIEEILHSLYTAPLAPWLRDQDPPPRFDPRTPACSRGYIGCWRITDDVLWLIDLHAWRDGRLTRVPDLFDGRREVAADWFTGPLYVEPAESEVAVGAPPERKTVFVVSGRVIMTQSGFVAAGRGESGRG